MSDEFETAGLASAGALASDARGEAGICANCAAPVARRYCPACGQLSTNLHRPIWMLVGEGLSDSLALDGRIARTLPALMLSPGKVTRAYLDGQRMSFVPPFRLFLLASLVFFTVAFTLGDRIGLFDGLRIVPDPDGGYSLSLGTENLGPDGATKNAHAPFLREDGSLDRDVLMDLMVTSAENEAADGISPEGRAAIERTSLEMTKVYNNQDQFFAAIQDWLPRLSLALLPVFSLLLALLYVWRRDIYVYDHLIATLHFQSWFYLFSAVLMGLAFFFSPWFLVLLIPAIPWYVYRLQRRVYRSGRLLGLARTVFLLAAALVALSMLVAGGLYLGWHDLSV